MTTIERYVTEIMQAFREKRGRGSCYCLYKQNMYNKDIKGACL